MPDLSGVQARFYVAEITQSAYGPPGAASVKLQAVSRGDQNKDWASATPSGTITMTINNPPAAKYFADALGKDVAVTFRLVDVATPEDGHAYRPSEAPAGSVYSAPNCGECGRPQDMHSA